MADYIEREVVIRELRDVYEREFPTADGAFDLFANRIVPRVIKNIPTAEVEPVRNGQWRRTGRILDGFIEVQCSECEETHLFDMIRLETAARYCPYCGVKWDGGADGANERRPIDAVALEARLCELCDEFDTDHLFIDAIIYEIGMAPTIGGADNG